MSGGRGRFGGGGGAGRAGGGGGTPGADVRTDIVDVYVFRRVVGAPQETVELLQLRRAREPLAGKWMPVMGRVEAGEAAVDAAVRELREETGLEASGGVLGFWCLEQVHPYFVPEYDAVLMTPRFVAEVEVRWEPTLDAEHTGVRWVRCAASPGGPERAALLDRWLWPGQRAAVEEFLEHIAVGGTETGEALRVELG